MARHVLIVAVGVHLIRRVGDDHRLLLLGVGVVRVVPAPEHRDAVLLERPPVVEIAVRAELLYRPQQERTPRRRRLRVLDDERVAPRVGRQVRERRRPVDCRLVEDERDVAGVVRHRPTVRVESEAVLHVAAVFEFTLHVEEQRVVEFRVDAEQLVHVEADVQVGVDGCALRLPADVVVDRRLGGDVLDRRVRIRRLELLLQPRAGRPLTLDPRGVRRDGERPARVAAAGESRTSGERGARPADGREIPPPRQARRSCHYRVVPPGV